MAGRSKVAFTTTLLVACTLLSLCNSYILTIPANKEKCLWVDVVPGAAVSLQFQVIEGGNLDVDFEVMYESFVEGQDLVEFRAERQSQGNYPFVAKGEGSYKACFDNSMSSFASKTLSVTFVANVPTQVATPEDEKNALESSLRRLYMNSREMREKQKEMKARMRANRRLNIDTNDRVVISSFIEAIILIAASIIQVRIIRRFFEVKRVV